LVNHEGTGAICRRESSGSPRGDAGHFHALDGTEPPPVEVRKKKDLLPKPRLATFQRIWQTQLTEERLDTLSQQLGLNQGSLVAVGMGWRGDCYTFPMYNADREIIGYRLRSPSGFKWTLAGTENGVFLPSLMQRADTLLVCEGPTDLAAALELGFMAIGRPNNISLKEETKKLIQLLEPRHVTIVADGDAPGHAGAIQFSEFLAPEFEAKVIAPTRHKDLREFVASGASKFSGKSSDWTTLI
jgi:5S rRNA maturation endonuclease (ribonuclease M5)